MLLAFYQAEPALLHHDSYAKDPAVRLQYLNEGGANIVYRLLPHPHNALLPIPLQGKLLRVRKGKPHIRSVQQQLHARERVTHLFPADHLVEQVSIQTDENLMTAIKDDLSLHRNRPASRRDDFPCLDEPYVLLITDMTPAESDTLLELKPKWLAQSPSAPRGATRCRTCALRAQRQSKGQQTATDRQAMCPLALVHEDSEVRRQAAKLLTDNPTIQDYLTNDSEVQLLLQTLKAEQQRLDPYGVLRSVAAGQPIAMTLRDCTLFMRLSAGRVEARLGDLDLKSASNMGKWRDVEGNLIGGGWYHNAGEEEVCLLAKRQITGLT